MTIQETVADFMARSQAIRDKVEAVRQLAAPINGEALSLAADVRAFAQAHENSVPSEHRDEFLGALKGLEMSAIELAKTKV